MVKLADANGAICSRWSDQNNNLNTKTVYNGWALITLPLANFAGVDKTGIKEIRIHFYWANTYYIDHVMKIR